MNSKFLKGLAMFVIGAIIPYLQVTPVDFVLVGVLAVLSAGIYSVKNAIPSLQSSSGKWQLDIINFFSGAALAALNALATGITTFVYSGTVDMKLAVSMAVSAFLGYLVATFAEGKK